MACACTIPCVLDSLNPAETDTLIPPHTVPDERVVWPGWSGEFRVVGRLCTGCGEAFAAYVDGAFGSGVRTNPHPSPAERLRRQLGRHARRARRAAKCAARWAHRLFPTPAPYSVLTLPPETVIRVTQAFRPRRCVGPLADAQGRATLTVGRCYRVLAPDDRQYPATPGGVACQRLTAVGGDGARCWFVAVDELRFVALDS